MYRRDIRHLDNHLDRTEETLHAMMVLLKRLIKDTEPHAASISHAASTSILQNILDNINGYAIMLGIQAGLIALGCVYIRSTQTRGPQKKAL